MGAPIVILAGRMLQGLSAGGEVGGAAAFLVEQAAPHERSRYAAWLQASMAGSNIIGAAVAFGVNAALSGEQVASWGWRIPFVIGLLIAPVGLWLRRKLDETPEYRAAERMPGHAAAGSPVATLFRDHRRALVAGFAISILWAVAVYALVIFLPIHVQRAFGISARDAFAASLAANVLFVAGSVGFGILADRIGRRRLMGASAAAMIVLFPLLMSAFAAAPTPGGLMAMQCVFCLLIAAFAAPAPAALAALFPVSVRATGMSITYNAAVTIFGGFAPAILTWLGAHGSGGLAPAWFAAASAVAGLGGCPDAARAGGVTLRMRRYLSSEKLARTASPPRCTMACDLAPPPRCARRMKDPAR